MELGSHSWMVCLAAELFLNSCSLDAVFVTLLRIAVETAVDDLRKSRGLHSVSAYRYGLYIQVHACRCSAELSRYCWGYTEHVGKMTDTRKQRQKRHQKCRSSAHCSWGTCRSDSRFPELVV